MTMILLNPSFSNSDIQTLVQWWITNVKVRRAQKKQEREYYSLDWVNYYFTFLDKSGFPLLPSRVNLLYPIFDYYFQIENHQKPFIQSSPSLLKMIKQYPSWEKFKNR